MPNRKRRNALSRPLPQTDKRGFKTKRDAQAFAEQIEVDKRRGLYVAPSDGRVTFGDLARAWLDSKHNLKRSTRARYEITLTVALAGFRDVAIADISRQMVRALVADLVNTGAAASSVHKAVGVLRQVLATAVADNVIAVNPAEGTDLPTVGMTEQRFLTTAELHRLALAAGEHRSSYRYWWAAGLEPATNGFASGGFHKISVIAEYAVPQADSLILRESMASVERLQNRPYPPNKRRPQHVCLLTPGRNALNQGFFEMLLFGVDVQFRQPTWRCDDPQDAQRWLHRQRFGDERGVDVADELFILADIGVNLSVVERLPGLRRQFRGG